MGACCSGRRELGKIDPSRGFARIACGRLADGRDDLGALPGFADGGGWLGAAVPAGPRLGTANCNIAVRDHTGNRSRRARSSRGIRAVEKHPVPCPPSRSPGRGWTTTTVHGRVGPSDCHVLMATHKGCQAETSPLPTARSQNPFPPPRATNLHLKGIPRNSQTEGFTIRAPPRGGHRNDGGLGTGDGHREAQKITFSNVW
jgi:hypothetical protein